MCTVILFSILLLAIVIGNDKNQRPVEKKLAGVFQLFFWIALFVAAAYDITHW